MSDSDSASSEPSPPSSRAASPDPQTEQPEADDTSPKDRSGNERTLGPINTDVKPPLLESDGVHFSWPDPSSFVDEPAEGDSITSFE